MKNKYIIIIASIMVVATIVSCDFFDNRWAKHYGGTMTIKVKKGYKVTEATWKDDQLWYLIEPMDSDYEPKKKEFVENSEYGVLEGKVIFKESK